MRIPAGKGCCDEEASLNPAGRRAIGRMAPAGALVVKTILFPAPAGPAAEIDSIAFARTSLGGLEDALVTVPDVIAAGVVGKEAAGPEVLTVPAADPGATG